MRDYSRGQSCISITNTTEYFQFQIHLRNQRNWKVWRMFSWLYMTFIKTQIFFKESHFQVCIFPRLIRIDFPNYVPLNPGIDYLCEKCFISLSPKMRKNPGNVESQVSFKQHSILKCCTNVISFYMFFLWKIHEALCCSNTQYRQILSLLFSVLFVFTNSELAKTQGLHW